MRAAQRPSKARWRGAGCELALGAVWAFWLGFLVSAEAAETNLPVLGTAAEVRQLSAEEAEHHYPVHLQGVLTFFDQRAPEKAFRFLQDETAGVYFYPPADSAGAAVGQRADLEGHTGRGEFAPVVLVERMRVLGAGAFPVAKPVSFEQLSSGQQDSQFVELRGVVRGVRLEEERLFFRIEMATGEGRVSVYASELPVTRSEELIDSAVRVRGVCFTQFNRQRQLFNFGLLVPRPEDLVVEKAGPADPFSMATQPLKSLLQYSAQGSYGHRLKVAGMVTLRYGDRLYLQQEHEGLCVQTRQTSPLKMGDRVEVLGFPARGEYTPIMENGLYRRVEPGPAVKPEEVSVDEALNGSHDCQLVAVKAVLLDRAQHSQEPFLVLQSGGFVFHAYLRGQESEAAFERLQKGSAVSVTGVCVVQAVEEWHYGENWRAASFRLLMRTPADIIVEQQPPWWTLRKLLWAVGLLLAAVVVALGWVALLRRRVQNQTEIIKEKLQAEAALKERVLEIATQEQQRIGQDLHDGVCQQLAAIVFRTHSLARRLQDQVPPESTEAECIGELVTEALNHTRGVARGLFPVRLEENGLISALEELAASICQRFNLNCTFACQGSPPALENAVALHAYYIAQEAVLNAAKHSRAERIIIRLVCLPERLSLTVQDDGVGFEPAETRRGGMGIAVMQYRAREIGATLDLKTRLGAGTELTCGFQASGQKPCLNLDER